MRPRHTLLRAIPLGCLPRDCLQARIESGSHALPRRLAGSRSQEALALHRQAAVEVCLLCGDRSLRQQDCFRWITGYAVCKSSYEVSDRPGSY